MADLKKLVAQGKKDINGLIVDRNKLTAESVAEENRHNTDIIDQIRLYNAVINVIVRNEQGVSPVANNPLEQEVFDIYNAKEEVKEIKEEVLEKPKKKRWGLR